MGCSTCFACGRPGFDPHSHLILYNHQRSLRTKPLGADPSTTLIVWPWNKTNNNESRFPQPSGPCWGLPAGFPCCHAGLVCGSYSLSIYPSDELMCLASQALCLLEGFFFFMGKSVACEACLKRRLGVYSCQQRAQSWLYSSMPPLHTATDNPLGATGPWQGTDSDKWQAAAPHPSPSTF